MNPFNFSGDQLKLIDYLESDRNVAIIEYQSWFDLEHLIISKLKKYLFKGETFIITLKDQKNVDQFLHLLKSHKLIDLAITLDNNPRISRQKISKKVVSDQSYQAEALKAKLLYQFNLKRGQELVSKYNSPVFGEYGRSKLAELLYLSKTRKKEHTLELDLRTKDFLFNHKEFWYLRGRIDKASKYFRSEYGQLKSSDEFSKDIYKDFHQSKNQEVIFKYLQKFIKDIDAIIQSYKRFFLQVKEKLVNQYLAEINAVNQALEKLAIELEYYAVEVDLAPSKKAFARQKDPLERQKKQLRSVYDKLLLALEQLSVFKTNAPMNSWTPDVQKLNEFCTKLKHTLESSHQLIQAKVEEQVEVLNVSNFNTEELEEINQLQDQFTYALAGSKLFEKEVQNLSISAWKNFQYLKSVSKKLKKNQHFLRENKDYAIYRSFEFSLESNALKVLIALEQYEKEDWIPIFEDWYFQALYKKYSFEESETMSKYFADIEESKFISQNFDLERIGNLFEQKIYNCQKADINAWSQIVRKAEKSNTDYIDCKTLLSTSKSIFKFTFPIIICLDVNSQRQKLLDLQYDNFISLGSDNISADFIGNSHFTKMLFTAPKELDYRVRDRIASAKNYNGRRKFNLSIKPLPDEVLIKDRLKPNLQLAKALASILKVVNYEKHFYSARDFSIISCLSPFCSRMLESALLDLKLKSLKYSSLDTGIVEDVILKQDKNKVILIQDGLLDPTLGLEWQISVVRTLAQIGLKVISVNVFELAMGTKASIMDFIDIPEMIDYIEKNQVIAS